MCSGMQGNNGLSVKTLCISVNSSLPCPPPPWANAAHLPTLEVHGVWGICKLCMHFFIAYQTFLWKWRNDRRSERNLCKLRKEALKKFRTSTGFEPVTSRYRCDTLPTELWSHCCWEQVNCGFIGSREKNECSWYMKNYIWTVEMKWKWNENEIVVAVNAIYAIA